MAAPADGTRALAILTASTRTAGSTATLHVVGEVDVASAGVLTVALAELLRTTSGTVVVDCGRWTFVDAAAMEVLRWFGDEAERLDRIAFLANLSPWMRALLHRCGVDAHFRSGMAGFSR